MIFGGIFVKKIVEKIKALLKKEIKTEEVLNVTLILVWIFMGLILLFYFLVRMQIIIKFRFGFYC